jgi:hypothetical protein
MGGVPEAAAPPDVEVRASLFDWQAAGAFLRIGKALALGDVAQHGQVGHRVALQYVTHRRGGIDQRRRIFGRLHRRPDPESEESTQYPSHHQEPCSLDRL